MTNNKYSPSTILKKSKDKMSPSEKALADLEVRKALDKLPRSVIENEELLADAIRLLRERLPKKAPAPSESFNLFGDDE